MSDAATSRWSPQVWRLIFLGVAVVLLVPPIALEFSGVAVRPIVGWLMGAAFMEALMASRENRVVQRQFEHSVRAARQVGEIPPESVAELRTELAAAFARGADTGSFPLVRVRQLDGGEPGVE